MNERTQQQYISDLSDQLILGWQQPERKLLGFANKQITPSNSSIITYQGGGHLATIGRTGSGKSRNVVIPNLLNYQGSKIALDIKGELYLTTSQFHQNNNYEVILIDPFYFLTDEPDCFNPFDLINFVSKQECDIECQNIAEMISIRTLAKDPFWDISAIGLLAGVISYVITILEDKKRNIKSLLETLMSDDVTYNLAVILDTGSKKISPMAYREISAFLQTAEITRGGILPTAYSYLKAFNNDRICQSFSKTTFHLNNLITDSKRFIIYFVIPPSYIQSHSQLIRLWFYSLMKIFTKRTEIPDLPTLFFLDEIAQFGDGFSILENVMTVGRGYGIKVWLFLQSLNQLKQNYPKSWRTMFENVDVIQVFQPNSLLTAKEIENLIGVNAQELLKMKPEEQYIVKNSLPEKANKLDYLTDQIFDGKWEQNPYYHRQNTTIEKKNYAMLS